MCKTLKSKAHWLTTRRLFLTQKIYIMLPLFVNTFMFKTDVTDFKDHLRFTSDLTNLNNDDPKGQINVDTEIRLDLHLA